MKEIRGIKRGVKMEPKPTNSQRIQEMDVEIKNLQMAGRLSQMMVQQLMTTVQNLTKDLGKSFRTINELQYKIMAMQEVGTSGHGHFDVKHLQAKADEFRLRDFTEASDAEDKSGNFTVGDKVQEDSTVILTSTTEDGSGLFRSRIKLSESAVPALIQGLMGQPVGTKVKCRLNGVEHEVELLGIRNPPSAAPVEQTEVVAESIPPNTVVH